MTDFLALLYNKNELAEAGITGPPPTMADFETDAVKIVQKKAAEYGFETGGTSYYALPFLYACGGGMFDQHNNILVNNTGSVEGLEFLLNLENDHVMRPVGDFGSATGNMEADFMDGKTAMIFDGPYDVKQILTGSMLQGYRQPGDCSVFQLALLDRPAHRSVANRTSSLLTHHILPKRTSSSNS